MKEFMGALRWRVQQLPPAQREEIEERAAIMEYDGKMERGAAEEAAVLCVRTHEHEPHLDLWRDYGKM